MKYNVYNIHRIITLHFLPLFLLSFFLPFLTSFRSPSLTCFILPMTCPQVSSHPSLFTPALQLPFSSPAPLYSVLLHNCQFPLATKHCTLPLLTKYSQPRKSYFTFQLNDLGILFIHFFAYLIKFFPQLFKKLKMDTCAMANNTNHPTNPAKHINITSGLTLLLVYVLVLSLNVLIIFVIFG